MTIQVTIGKWYAVSGAAGATVTTPDGSITLCTIPDGGQGYFNAPTTSVETSDDTVKVTQATFNYALAALGLLGGGVKINLMKYAHCKTYADMVAVNPDFANDLTSNGEWIYPLPEVERIEALNNLQWLDGWWTYSPIKKAVITLPKATYSVCLFTHNQSIEYAEVYLPVSTHINRILQNTRMLKHAKVNAPKALSTAYLFTVGTFSYTLPKVELYAPKTENIVCLASYRSGLVEVLGEYGAEVTDMTDAFKACFALKVFPTNYPKLKTANNAFDRVEMTGQQAIEILTSIPAWTDGAAHPITMGIHIDYQNDVEVLAAIDNATAKGWTVTTQWTGTPTSGASTFGFKRIWVRKREDEQGEYVAQDGTRWMVEWCDSISAPDGSTPEDHGYEPFRSVEAAVAYWELQPYVYPEEEQLLTD